jgi:hypothetical protein
MKKLLVLILFASCTKEYKYIPTPIVQKEDTTFSIYMDRCPNSILTCFWVNNYPNYKDTVRLNVSWSFGNNSFTDTLVITQKYQVIYTNKLFYGVVPFKY